jgi:copper chaperone CopZ
MTKVQIHFRLQKALDDTALPNLAAAHAIYGIQKLKLSPSLDAVDVEYDATRLKRADVVRALSAAGVPIAE